MSPQLRKAGFIIAVLIIGIGLGVFISRPAPSSNGLTNVASIAVNYADGSSRIYDSSRPLELTMMQLEDKLGGLTITDPSHSNSVVSSITYTIASTMTWTGVVNSFALSGGENVLVNGQVKQTHTYPQITTGGISSGSPRTIAQYTLTAGDLEAYGSAGSNSLVVMATVTAHMTFTDGAVSDRQAETQLNWTYTKQTSGITSMTATITSSAVYS